MAQVLVVEDQPAVATALRMLFEIRGQPCRLAATPEEALVALGDGRVGVVVQDMNFSPSAQGGEEGVALFRRIRRRDPELPVVLLTAWTSLPTAVEMVKEGASDYLAKPWDDERLFHRVRELLQGRARRQEAARARLRVASARDELLAEHDLCGAVYASPLFHQLVGVALQVAPADAPVLVTGPSGAGKEKIAEIVHANSARRQRPLVRVNAGALPDTLLEAELFGVDAGAYTGATRRRGRFETADGGTLFLDEIGNLSLSGQMKLLRVLQSGSFERLGSSETRRVDVRLVCATNADLRQEIAAGRFREDLYYRLNVVELRVPPLAERPEDVLALAEDFLARLAVAAGPGWRLSAAAAERLLRHSWPGNVRELHNVLRRATLVGAPPALEPEDLGIDEAPARARPAGAPPPALDDPLALAERLRLERALAAAGGVVAKAAQALGISRQALYRRLERHGMTVERRLRS